MTQAHQREAWNHTAAVLAMDAGIAVQDVPYARLRERLLRDGQILEYRSAP